MFDLFLEPFRISRIISAPITYHVLFDRAMAPPEFGFC